MTDSRGLQIRKVCLFLFIALFMVFLYTCLHEGGHAVAALLSGGRITEFSINFFNISAHVGVFGDFTLSQVVLQNLAGVGLPLLVWLVFILLTPRRANLALEGMKLVGSLGILNGLLVWIIFPILYLYGKAPSDDAVNFLANSGANPLLVSAAALLIFIAGWAVFFSRIEGVRSEIALIRAPGSQWLSPGLRRTVGVMLGLSLVFLLGAYAANGFHLTTSARLNTLEPPPGYSLVRTLKLPEAGHSAETVFSFNLEQAKIAGVFLRVQNISTPYFDAILSGPDGYQHTILHGEVYSASLDAAHVHEKLPPGQYSVLITSQKSPGSVAIYSTEKP